MTRISKPGRVCQAIAASLALCLAGCGSQDDGPPGIRGSARLPQCTEAAAFDLNGNTWIDRGTITTLSTGCLDAGVGATFTACTLQWVFSQQGREIQITVDNEYKVAGRMCGDRLHLEGGWWLPVTDDNGNCSYADEDGSEVGIEQEGSQLAVSTNALSGTLRLQGACTAEYEVTFSRYTIH